MGENYEELLKKMEKFYIEHGYPATREELRQLWGLSSKCLVQARLVAMEERGLVHRDNRHMIPTRIYNLLQAVTNG